MIVCITGPSCSGKTSLARALGALLDAPTLHLDQHFVEAAERPVVMGHPSFERPHQYDAASLLIELYEAAARNRHVVAEGFLLLTYDGFDVACDHHVHLDVPHAVLAERRRARLGAADDVKGGRIKDADAAWAAHGEAEWLRYGAVQATMPGVRTLRPMDMGAAGLPDALARSLLAEWGISPVRPTSA